MSEAGNQQEPSMEEILASIRKIISEDGEEEQQEEAVEEAPLELVDEAGSEEAPLELTDEAVPEDEHEIEFVEEEPEPLAAEAEVPEPEPIPEPGPVAEPEPILEMDAMPEPEPIPEPDPIPEPTPPAPVVSDEKIVSQPVMEAGAAAFGQLARTMRPERSPGGGITVEELASDLMRPMLREWLDENLPGMVERLVRREIERMARNGDED